MEEWDVYQSALKAVWLDVLTPRRKICVPPWHVALASQNLQYPITKVSEKMRPEALPSKVLDRKPVIRYFYGAFVGSAQWGKFFDR